MFGFVTKHYKVTHFKIRPKKAEIYPVDIIGGRQRCYKLRIL